MMHVSPLAAAVLQTVAATGQHHGPLYPITHGIARFGQWIGNIFKPLGLWGLAGFALLDSALVPLGGMIGWIVFYVAVDHQSVLLCALISAAMGTLGSLLPYYIGRAGGEAFLLKKINRERYERMRDRFERQEFIAIMLPAMAPPPVPLKLFEFCAGVFEMRVRSYVSALFAGKFLQFLMVGIFARMYGPSAAGMLQNAFRNHARGVLLTLGVLLVVVAIWMVRRTFARRAEQLPIEEEAGLRGTHTVVEE